MRIAIAWIAAAAALAGACTTPPEVWDARPALVLRDGGSFVRVPPEVRVSPDAIVRWEGRTTTQLVLFTATGVGTVPAPAVDADGTRYLPVTLPKAWRDRELPRYVWWRYPNRDVVRIAVVLERGTPAADAAPGEER